jgi:outer membrane lipoprotein-sorting protein
MLAAAAVVVLAVGGGVAGAAARANRTASLPSIAADRLIATTMQALDAGPTLSGTVASHVDLGLPSLSGLVAADTNPTDVVAGDHSIRIWHSPDGVRIDDLLPMAQRSLFVSRSAAWAWDSQTFTAYRMVGRSATVGARPASPVPDGDPLELARRALSSIDPTTKVSVETSRYVAGRAAYVLRFTPRATGTLVGAVEVWIDAAHRVPLRVAVFARGASKAAVSEGFTSVRFGSVNPAIFRFSPPRGATVRTVDLSGMNKAGGHDAAARPRSSGALRTFGSGWEEVVAFPVPAATGNDRTFGMLRKLLPYAGPLFSVDLVTRSDHQWIVAGMVPPPDLATAAAQLP